MKKYLITATWEDGSTHDYEVMDLSTPGNPCVLDLDPVQAAKSHLNSTQSVISYTVKDERGNLVYEKTANNR